MVSKNVLRKLSDAELDKYLIAGNRFTPEAVEVAFEILQERGRHFSEPEKEAINEMILAKKREEENRTNEEKEIWKDHVTEDPNAIKLYSRTTIIVLTVLFGTIPGSVLLFLNFLTVRRYVAAVFTLLIGFGIFFLQNYILSKGFDNHIRSRHSPEMGVIALGAIILMVISVSWMPKKLPYRSKSLIFPVILAIVMTVLLYINYKGWFSTYPFASVFRLLRDF
ncbi:hypothetical protein SAMN05421856_10255 [Chryseobacterium taichungense]|uniref:Uncharacterized protein n=1 Tax=Chryseobacterium taichungense TaxID=295069 RepID=A0A1H7WYU8_9FLAO|nr:hypothetical protein [Chryseobacterium taichungense]SEM26079.1 hypothetical protein SAMN05421856_10255 [Chryseobacterium taichungense]